MGYSGGPTRHKGLIRVAEPKKKKSYPRLTFITHELFLIQNWINRHKKIYGNIKKMQEKFM